MAVLLMAILAIGAVSAESIDDADASIAIDDGDSGIELSDSPAEDVSTLSTVDDSTVAADEDVENILGDERPSYDLNDDTYSTYFNDDGTAKDILVPGDQAGDYDLVIGTLNDKKIIIDYGSQINIVAKEGEGIINNGTIIIGDDYGNAGSVFISGLTFNNYNKDGIDVREGSTDIQIDNNKFNLEYDSTFGNTSIAIATHGFVSGVSITNNVITMKSDVMYTYGIDLIHYLSIDPSVAGMDAAEDFNVSDNTIIIDSTAQTGMAEGMYLDTLVGSLFENNIIKISTMGACANYGIQLADSYAFFDFDNWAPSPYNVTIKGNDISLKSTDMAYGITVISIYGWGPNMEDDWIKDMVIADNTVNIESQKGAIGIGAKSSDVEITNNNVFVIANAEAINGAYPDGEFGDETAVITLVTFDPNMGAVDYDYSNITVTGNTITTNVAPFNITKNDTGNQPLVVEDNTIKTITEIDDSNYATYFNEDGTIKTDAPINPNDIIVLGELNNKKLVIDIPLTIKGNGNKLTNTTISLVTGADGTTVSGLDMYYEDDGSAVFAIIAVNNGVSDVVIADNTIFTVSASSWNYDMAISVYGAPVGSKNITISGNTITMSGDAGGLYAIDVQNYDPYWTKGQGTTGLTITDNNLIISGSSMVEPIYISNCNDILVDGNVIMSSTSGGDAYGIGTSTNNNFTVTNNMILVASQNNMAYGVASPDSKDVVIDNNNITASGVGAIGIGFVNDENVEVDGNTITIYGGDYTTVSTYEKIGTGNAAILDKSGNTGVVIGENTIVENCPLTINDNNYATYFNEDGTIKDDAPISANDLIFLGELNNKKFVIDVPLTVKGANGNKLTNTTISLVTGADGTTISGLDMYYEDDGSAVFAIIAVNNGVSNVEITKNTITTVSSSSWNYDMAISVYGAPVGSKNITISGNTITMSGDAGGLYAIDAQNYDPYWNKGQGVTGLNISDNIISVTGSGMVEPIYVSNCNDILVDGNKITSSSTGGDAYAIGSSANNNFTITNNEMDVTSEKKMAYGVASPDSKDVVIDNNNITSTGIGAIGVGFINDENVEVDGNIITITGEDYSSISTYEKIGTGNAAILDKSGNTGVVIGQNTITENCPLTIDDSNYATYFNNDGTIKDDAPISANDLILLGNLTNKKLVIDVPLTIKGIKNMKLTNTTIDLVTGADGTTIRGLDMYYEDDGSAVFAVIAVNNGVSDVVIADNTITTVSAPSWNYDMAISVYGSEDGSKNIAITGNTITMSGDAGGLYAIDVQNYDPFWNKGKGTTGLTIKDNIISISSSGMVEPIYVSNCNDILVEGNTITSSTTGGDAYGIGTASNNNITFRYNEIDVSSQNNIAYGITSTLSNDVVIDENTITSTGVAAVGVGIQNDKGVEINGNTISITGEDYTLINTFDSLGPANAAILNKQESNTDLVIGENTLTENGEVTTEIKVGTGAEELQKLIDNAAPGSTIDLGDKDFYKVSDVVIDKDLTITGGNIVGEPGKAIFVVAPKSADGPSEVNITDVNFKVNDATTIVQATADNATNPTAIDVASINIKNNNIELASEDVVAESVTVLELDSERGVLAPTGEIAVSGNNLPAGVDPFDFKVTSIATDDGVVIPDGPISTERTETEIIYQNMTTTAVDVDTDGRVGKYFYITLKDKNGNLLKNKPIQIGFNGVVYDRTTDENGSAKLQINLKNAGTYTFAVSYLGDDAYNGSFIVAKIVVNKQKGSLTVPNKSYKASASTKSLTATFKSASGKVVKGKKITFTVNGKSYSATTNAKGVATVKVSLNTKGTYSFTAKFAGNTMYAAISKKATLKIT